MEAKTLLLEEIEREYRYMKSKEVGTDDYNASMGRFNTLVEKLADLEKFEDENKERYKNRIIDIVKFVVNGVISIGMAVFILKFEETGSIRTALRSLVTGAATRKML